MVGPLQVWSHHRHKWAGGRRGYGCGRCPSGPMFACAFSSRGVTMYWQAQPTQIPHSLHSDFTVWLLLSSNSAVSTSFSPPQTEIKAGTIVLQSCDACASFGAIVEVGWRIINEVSRILWTMQPAPRLPPSPSDYVGVYVGRVTQTATVRCLPNLSATWPFNNTIHPIIVPV